MYKFNVRELGKIRSVTIHANTLNEAVIKYAEAYHAYDTTLVVNMVRYIVTKLPGGKVEVVSK